MHGLARVMPRFAALFSLFVMAAVGLPFFALFSAQMELLLRSSLNTSWELVVILLSLVSGFVVFVQNDAAASVRAPSRGDALRGSAQPANAPGSMIVLVILAMLGIAPSAWLEAPLSANLHRTRHGDDTVAQVATQPYSESQRMQLRTLIRLASETHRLLLADANIRASQPAAWPRTSAF